MEGYVYQDMGSWFVFDFPEPASAFGARSVYDEYLGRDVEVDPSTLVFPVYQGLPPGWSWSLFFCNLSTADCMAVGIGRCGGKLARVGCLAG